MTIDVRARRAERLFGVVALLGAMAAGLLLFPTASPPAAALFGSAVAAVLAGLWSHGWLGGPRRLAKIAWLPDGQWQLSDACHTNAAAELRADSRVGARWLWLRWNAESAGWRPPAMLLVRGDIPAADFRRLTVRLRLDAPSHRRREPAPRPFAAESPVRDDDF